MKIHRHLSLAVIPAHILFVILFFYINLTWYILPIAFLLWIVIGGIGLDIGLHRIISHRQFTVSPLIEKIVSFLGTLSLNGSPISWRALHIGYHHPYSDTSRDFHSPVNGGFLNAYVLYINKLEKMALLGCRDLLNDKFQVFLHKNYIVITWATLISSFMVSPVLCFSLMLAMIMSYHQTAIVNVLCHDERFGYALHLTKDKSRNIRWLSYFTFGLSLHNTHHRYPIAANYAILSNEYDVGYKLAKLLGFKENTSI